MLIWQLLASLQERERELAVNLPGLVRQKKTMGKLWENHGKIVIYMENHLIFHRKTYYFYGHGFNSYVTNYQRVPMIQWSVTFILETWLIHLRYSTILTQEMTNNSWTSHSSHLRRIHTQCIHIVYIINKSMFSPIYVYILGGSSHES